MNVLLYLLSKCTPICLFELISAAILPIYILQFRNIQVRMIKDSFIKGINPFFIDHCEIYLSYHFLILTILMHLLEFSPIKIRRQAKLFNYMQLKLLHNRIVNFLLYLFAKGTPILFFKLLQTVILPVCFFKVKNSQIISLC